MKIHKVGRMYKAVIITGPQHNYLGLVLTPRLTQPMSVREVRLQNDPPEATVAQAELLQAVEKGVREANTELQAQYKIEELEYVPTDTWDADAYALLAANIVRAMWNDSHAPPL